MPETPSTSPQFDVAMDALGQALGHRKVEPICTAYLALRRARKPLPSRELPDRVKGAHGAKALAMVLSAFSHRRCFMCEEGVADCPTCDGTGRADRFNCPTCDGLGVQPCTFCQGAGWAGHSDTPGELLQAILQRQVARLDQDISRLGKLPSGSKLATYSLSLEKRKELVGWLVRMRARLLGLAGSPVETWGDHSIRYGSLATRVEGLLAALRPSRLVLDDEGSDEEL